MPGSAPNSDAARLLRRRHLAEVPHNVECVLIILHDRLKAELSAEDIVDACYALLGGTAVHSRQHAERHSAEELEELRKAIARLCTNIHLFGWLQEIELLAATEHALIVEVALLRCGEAGAAPQQHAKCYVYELASHDAVGHKSHGTTKQISGPAGHRRGLLAILAGCGIVVEERLQRSQVGVERLQHLDVVEVPSELSDRLDIERSLALDVDVMDEVP
mmetsp:Transcript_1291/g.2783  ORF Transcript_1291/g.2783 Transcript_1291/m.2783 type:complete len:219 (-) Transcript_1291:452-1108(-)